MTAFFGIGAMRAGTSWLGQFLRQHPDCGMAPLKELHFFDVRYGFGGGPEVFRRHSETLERWSVQVNRRIASELDKIDRKTQHRPLGQGSAVWDGDDAAQDEDVAIPDDCPVPASVHPRLAVLEGAGIDDVLNKIIGIAELLTVRSAAAYASYLRRYAGSSAVFGEISPSYAVLPSEAFAEMNSLFPGAKFILIMRDPVDRLWSQIRYGESKAKRRREQYADPNDAFDDARRRRQRLARSNYHCTIEALERVIPPEQILYLFYETMTSMDTGREELRRVEHFLGLESIEIPKEMMATLRNASEPQQMSPENEAAAMRMCGPVYEYIERRFGLPRGWREPQSRGPQIAGGDHR